MLCLPPEWVGFIYSVLGKRAPCLEGVKGLLRLLCFSGMVAAVGPLQRVPVLP